MGQGVGVHYPVDSHLQATLSEFRAGLGLGTPRMLRSQELTNVIVKVVIATANVLNEAQDYGLL